MTQASIPTAKTVAPRARTCGATDACGLEFLELVLQDEVAVRDHRKLDRRTKLACFRDLACPNCGGDIRLISFITNPGPIRKILTHLGEPLEPPRVPPARGPPVDWGELVQSQGAGEFKQASPDDLPMIDIHHR